MPNPKVLEEEPLCLADVKDFLEKIENREKELGYRANKTKEYLHTFVELSKEQKDELYKKLAGLKLVRLKEIHIAKIIDFLPKTTEDLKTILQAYTVNLPKKEMESIIAVVKEISKT